MCAKRPKAFLKAMLRVRISLDEWAKERVGRELLYSELVSIAVTKTNTALHRYVRIAYNI